MQFFLYNLISSIKSILIILSFLWSSSNILRAYVYNLMRHFESLRKMDTCKLRRCSFSFLLPLLIILVLQIASQQYRKLQQNRYPTFAFFLFLFFLLLIYNDLNYNPVFYTHWQRMVFFYNTLTRVLASLIKY